MRRDWIQVFSPRESHLASLGPFGRRAKITNPRSREGSPSKRKSHCQPASPAMPFMPRIAPDMGEPITPAATPPTANQAIMPARCRGGYQ